MSSGGRSGRAGAPGEVASPAGPWTERAASGRAPNVPGGSPGGNLGGGGGNARHDGRSGTWGGVRAPRMKETWKGRIRRWLTVNAADTRDPEGPAGRLYTAPFARVWDALLDEIARRSRWELVHKDEGLGMLSVQCRLPVLRFLVDDLTVWMTLDENALTRVEARSRSRAGRGDLGVNRRRLRRLMESLDEAVGRDQRMRGGAGRRGGRAAAGAGRGGTSGAAR